jgi:hypothetical protein
MSKLIFAHNNMMLRVLPSYLGYFRYFDVGISIIIIFQKKAEIGLNDQSKVK